MTHLLCRSPPQQPGSFAGSRRGSVMAPDPWLSTYDSTCHIAQEIAEKIQQRNQCERNGENTTKLTIAIRVLLQNLKEKITLLKELLLRAVSTHQITQLEGDQRQNLLDDLVTRERLLQASCKNDGTEPDLISAILFPKYHVGLLGGTVDRVLSWSQEDLSLNPTSQTLTSCGTLGKSLKFVFPIFLICKMIWREKWQTTPISLPRKPQMGSQRVGHN
ncbi:syntaxin-8 isoform X2 [Phascolarctos cinereus]